MKYEKYTKEQQRETLNAQILDLESQHFQQVLFAESAEAAAEMDPPSDVTEELRTEYDEYVKNCKMIAYRHRRSAAEAEQRVLALRALAKVIDGGGEEATTPKRSKG